MSKWSPIWSMPKATRAAALHAARFTPPSQKSRGGQNPADQLAAHATGYGRRPKQPATARAWTRTP